VSLGLAVRSILALFVVLSILWVPIHVRAAAAPIEESPGCDPEFWDVLEARTWLEGQREVEAASRLILKADSVLQYTCFNDRISELASAADWIFSDRVVGAPLFTNHPMWRQRHPPPPGVAGASPFTPIYLGPNGPDPPGGAFTALELDKHLNNLVRGPMNTYLGNNFNHTYGGGLGPVGGVCMSMNTVWNFLRCQDYDKDLFISLKDMPGNDPRTLPYTCPNAGARTAKWNLNLLKAFPPPSLPAALGGMDLKEHYNNRMNNNGGCSGAFPISTGVVVKMGGGNHPDAVCSIPGCSYDGSGGCF